MLDKGSQIPYDNLGVMWGVQEAVNPEGAHPGDANKEWTRRGAQPLSSFLGMNNPANCMWAAGMGYQCLPETKGQIPKLAFKSNDSFISAVNKGTVPFKRVAKTNESDFDSKEKGLLRPGDIINFKGTNDTGDPNHPNTSHAMTFSHYREDGTPIYLDSNGDAHNFNWNPGVWSGMKPNAKRTAYISRFDPESFYADEIKTLEEKARTNPTYYDAGGTIEIKLDDNEIEEYRKGGYVVEDISVPSLTRMQPGGPVPDSTYTPIDPNFLAENPDTYSQIVNKPEVSTGREGSDIGKLRAEYRDKNPMDKYLDEKKRQYLKKNKGLNKAAGVTMENFPEDVLQNFMNEYNYKTNNYAVNKLGKKEGWNPKKRGEWVDELTPGERDAVSESKYGSKLQPSYWSRSLAGLATLAAPFSPEIQNIMNEGHMPGLTKKESKEF